ncbi:MAG: ribonuclease E activity regulator RraA [Chromatiales bacterium]|nr:MAG: ribonuclease E activity regulator RraA [Chromatiales bacterium]
MTLHQLESTTSHLHLPAAATADICDANPAARVLLSWFRSFGGKSRCAGPVEIVSTLDDNSLVKAVLQEPGAGRVLLIDNQGSCTCAMLGGGLAQLAVDNGWAGVVVNGAVRDSAELKETPLAVFALATSPRRSINRSIGKRGLPVRVGSERITQDDFLVADADGVVVLASRAVMGELK